MTGNRSVRRRQERDQRRGRTPLIVGDNLIAAPLGEEYEPRSFAELPAKQPGRHRWLAMASFVVDVSDDLIGRADVRKILGPRNIHTLGVGCWDCEQTWADCHDTPCPAEAAD